MTRRGSGPRVLYISRFVFPALLTLVGASWFPFVLARPVRNVALAAERIAAGERGVRVEKDETGEEFVKLTVRDPLAKRSEPQPRSWGARGLALRLRAGWGNLWWVSQRLGEGGYV